MIIWMWENNFMMWYDNDDNDGDDGEDNDYEMTTIMKMMPG